MGCLEIAALAVRLITVGAQSVESEPGLFVETGCGIEAGISSREGAAVADLGWRRAVAGPLWVRAGVEIDRRTRVTVLFRPSLGPGESRGQWVSRATAEPTIEARTSLSFGFDIPVGDLVLAPEFEAARGGRFLLSARFPIARTAPRTAP